MAEKVVEVGNYAQEALEANDVYKPQSRLRRVPDLQVKPPGWLVHGLIPENGFGQLVAPSNKGKTYVALDLALRVAHNNEKWHGHDIDRHGDVIYCAMEGVFDFPARVRAWELDHLDSLTEEPRDLWVLPEETLNLIDPWSLFQLAVDILAADTTPALVVIDTRALATTGADENDNEVLGAVAKRLKQFANQMRTVVLLVHHTPAGNAIRSRGATAVTAACDFEFAIEVNGDDGPTSLICNKNKYGPKPDSWPFELKVNDLGTVDDRGRPESNAWAAPRKGAAKKSLGDAIRAVTPENLRARIMAAIIAEPGIGANAIATRLGGNDERIKAEIHQLADDGIIEIVVEGNRHKHFIVP
jgi:hypothetical protein